MSQSLATVAYLGAAILFILSLGGLSNPETSRRGNLLGMVGMALAVLATVFGPPGRPLGPGLDCGGPGHWWRHWPVRRPRGEDDANARAGGADAQPGWPGRLPGRLCQLCGYSYSFRGGGENHP